MNHNSIRRAETSLSVFVLALAGCASSVPKAVVSQPVTVNSRISANDQTSIHIEALDSAKVLPSDIQRLTEKIAAKIDTRKRTNTPDGVDARSYQLDLYLTRYDKGNAFARAMLAGLGQIHIDGKVTLFRMPEHTAAGEFQLAKTFAWGGIYGAATSMDDIENTFADGVAANVTGQTEDPKKDQSKNK